MIKVLFICHGNICRSPMAEIIMKDMVKKRNISDLFMIRSAATSTEEIWNGVGNPVYPPAAAELRKHGLSSKGKRAVQIRKEDYEFYDYLICMDKYNVKNLERIIGSDTEHKVSLLLDYTDRPGASISDPWFSRDFETTYKDIVEGLEGLIEFLGF